MGSFTGAFYLSALADRGGTDANTYAMSASFLGIVVAFLLAIKPLWLLLYPFYLYSLYSQGKTRLDHLEVF
jgi:uncharacterized membrane protein